MKRAFRFLAVLTAAAALGALAACSGEHVHKYTDWETVTEAECEKPGLRTRSCKSGDDTQSETIPVLGHSYNADNKCTRCGKEIKYTQGLGYLETEGGYAVALGTSSEKNIVVPAYYEGTPVVAVLDDGFKDAVSIGEDGSAQAVPAQYETVWLPDGILSVGTRAFYGAAALKEITLPATLKTIGDNAFGSCTSLKTVNVPRDLIEIASNAFNGCTVLAAAPLGDKLVSVGDFAFAGCNALETANFYPATERIGKYAFESCASLKYVTVGGAVTTIEESTFLRCTALLEATLPATLKTIGSTAFGYCSSLKKFHFGGTREEWKQVTCASDWMAGDFLPDELPMFYIYCTDGTLNRYNLDEVPPANF